MAIWDSLRQDPMSAMILMKGLSDLTGSMSKQNLPPRGAYAPAGYGQQDGGMEDMIPQMLRMQQMQAQQANMAADNELARQKMAIAQDEARRQQENIAKAAQVLGVDPSVLALNMEKFGENAAEKVGVQTLSPGQRAMVGDKVIADNPALLQAEYGGVFNPRSGGFSANPAMQQFDLAKAAAGATRISNPVSITQDTLAAEMAKTPAAMFRKVADAAYAAQSGLDATRSIYELAKQNSDLFGPGMQLKADAAKAIEAAKNVVESGGQPSADQARLLAVAKAVEVRQVNSAISKLRDIGGNDTEKEYERVLKAIPGLETSLPTHEAVFIQEKTAADYLSGMQEYVAQKTAQATQDRSLGITTVDDAISEYKRANPLGDQLAKNLQTVMQANGIAPPAQAPVSAPQSAAPTAPPAGAPPGTPQHLWKYFTP